MQQGRRWLQALSLVGVGVAFGAPMMSRTNGTFALAEDLSDPFRYAFYMYDIFATRTPMIAHFPWRSKAVPLVVLIEATKFHCIEPDLQQWKIATEDTLSYPRAFRGLIPALIFFPPPTGA